MKTMKTTVNSSVKTGRISDTEALASQFSQAARQAAKGWVSPLEKTQAALRKANQSDYSPEEYSLIWGKGCLNFVEDGFTTDGVITFDKEGNYYLGEYFEGEEPVVAFAKDEVLYKTALRKAARGLFETIKENTLVNLVDRGLLSYNEMGKEFRRLQGVWGHSKRIAKDLAEEVANLLKKVGMTGTREGRLTFRELCALKKERLG